MSGRARADKFSESLTSRRLMSASHPARHRSGRVSSLNTAICWSLMPLGGVLGGLAIAGFGLSPALLIAGAAYLVTTMAPTRMPSFRQMDRAPAAPAPVSSGV